MKKYPKGYWSDIFDQAASLMNTPSGLSGETAYWLARRMVDRKLANQHEEQDDLATRTKASDFGRGS